MNVAGIYIDSLSVHSMWGVAGENRFGSAHENYKSRDMILSLDDKFSPLQGHSFSRQGSHKVCSNFCLGSGRIKHGASANQKLSQIMRSNFISLISLLKSPMKLKSLFPCPYI